MRPATSMKGRTSSSGGGASITIRLRCWPLQSNAEIAAEAGVGRPGAGWPGSSHAKPAMCAASGSSQRRRPLGCRRARRSAGAGRSSTGDAAARHGERGAGRPGGTLMDNRFYKSACRAPRCSPGACTAPLALAAGLLALAPCCWAAARACRPSCCPAWSPSRRGRPIAAAVALPNAAAGAPGRAALQPSTSLLARCPRGASRGGDCPSCCRRDALRVPARSR